MKRNYEIAVVSRGGFARTVRIFGGKNAKSALLILDGASIFEQSNKHLFQKCKQSKLALVGIDGTDRLNEFLPFKCENASVAPSDIGGKASELSEYLLETLIPYIKKRFSIEKIYLLGHSLSAAAALYTSAQKDCGISAFGLIDPPLFASPVAFDGFFKRAEFTPASYYVACTTRPEILPEGTPRKAYEVSAVSIVAALVNCGVTAVELKTKTDAASLAESVSDCIDFFDEACLYE